VVKEVGGVEGVNDEVDLCGAVALFPNFEAQRTLTDIRTFGGSGLAVGGTGVDVAIVAWGLDGKVP